MAHCTTATLCTSGITSTPAHQHTCTSPGLTGPGPCITGSSHPGQAAGSSGLQWIHQQVLIRVLVLVLIRVLVLVVERRLGKCMEHGELVLVHCSCNC